MSISHDPASSTDARRISIFVHHSRSLTQATAKTKHTKTKLIQRSQLPLPRK